MHSWTRRAVIDLFPDYIYERLAGHREREAAIALEAGISVDALTFDSLGSLAYAPLIAKDGVLSVSRHRWRTPYTTMDPWTPVWNELVAAGFAESSGDGWRLTARGGALCERLYREERRYLESLELPTVELHRLAIALTSLAERIPASAERATTAHKGLPLQSEIRSHVVRADRAINELWNFRDDSHIDAWQAAGYSGPELDVLSRVWMGITTMDALSLELEWTQDPADVRRDVDALAQRGDLDRDGDRLALTLAGKERRDAIERQTDRAYFAGWPTGDELSRVGEDLSAVIAALPSSQSP